jgi:signal recognition particle subunit SRP72
LCRAAQAGQLDSLEARTNMVAAYVAAGRSTDVPSLMATLGLAASDSFEVAYNAGCAALAQGRLREAREQLLLAHRMGREALLEEEYTEEEVEEELLPSACVRAQRSAAQRTPDRCVASRNWFAAFAHPPEALSCARVTARCLPVCVQLAYVDCLQGRKKGAVETYSRLLKLKSTDTVSAAVAANNLVAERGHHELFDGLKRLDKMLERGGTGTRCVEPQGRKGNWGRKLQGAVHGAHRLIVRASCAPA